MKKAVEMWKMYLPELYQMLAVILAGELIGIVLVKITVGADPTAKGYVVLGSFIAICLGMFITMLDSIILYGSKFNLAVSMGCTRKEFFVSYWIGTVLFVFIEIAVVWILGFLETGLGRIMYANTFLSEAFNALPYLMDYRVVIGLLLLVPAFVMFVGVLILKFQMKVFWVFWVFWMVVSLGGVKVSDIISENPDSMLANIVNNIFCFAKTITGPMLVLLFIVVCAVITAVSAILLRKQEVR